MSSLALKQQTIVRTCDFCNAEEGKLRHIGEFIVQLTPVLVDGEDKLACQTCLHKDSRIRASALSDSCSTISSSKEMVGDIRTNRDKPNLWSRTFVITIELSIPGFLFMLSHQK